MPRLLPLRRHPWTLWAFAAAAAADALTFIAMGTLHELNPIAAHWPELAIAAKAVLVGFVLLAPLQQYRNPVAAFGAGYFLAGCLSNLAVIGGP